MADDCGDCGDCGDCDCNCDDCGCDCDCCTCDCFDNCCTGETNVILCCFLPAYNDPGTTRQRRNTDCSCCFWCIDRDHRTIKSNTSDKSSKTAKRKGFCSRLRSCFGRETSPPSSPTRQQPPMDNAPQDAYYRDGRYRMNDNLSAMTRMDYEEQRRRHSNWEELGMSSSEYKMDGKWSGPVKYGDRYRGHS